MKFRVSICILRLLDDIISLVPGALLEIFYVQEIIKMSVVQIYTSRHYLDLSKFFCFSFQLCGYSREKRNCVFGKYC